MVVTTFESLVPCMTDSLDSEARSIVHIVAASDGDRRRELGLDKAHRLVAAEGLVDSLMTDGDGVVISSDEDVEPLDARCVERLVAAAAHPGVTATVTYTDALPYAAPWWRRVAHANLAFNNQIFAVNAAFFEHLHGLILGWTTVIWRSDLRSIGGFRAATRYLTEDVVLGNELARHGVRTHLFDSKGALQIADTLRSPRDFWRQQVRWRAHLRALHPVLLALVTLGLPLSVPVLSAAALSIVDPGPIAFALLASALLLSGRSLGVSVSHLWTLPCHELLTLASHVRGMSARHAYWGPWRYAIDARSRILSKTWLESPAGEPVPGLTFEAQGPRAISPSLDR